MDTRIHINSMSAKLSRATAMLAKIRHYLTKDILRSIYFGIFSSILTYGCHHFIRLEGFHNKAIKIINFESMRDSVTPLYKVTKIYLITLCYSISYLYLMM